jgi:glutaredoxin-like protein NrdH
LAAQYEARRDEALDRWHESHEHPRDWPDCWDCEQELNQREDAHMANPPTVTVYTKPACQPCKATKRWLTERDIAFDEADATAPDNTAALQALGYLQAPVTFISTGDVKNDIHFSGFNPVALEAHILGEAAA